MRFEQFFQAAPAAVDVSEVARLAQAARSAYDPSNWVLPLPVWRGRPYDDSGADAWEILRAELERVDGHKRLSVYLHVPFCSGKCGFCDSYSFTVTGHRQTRMDAYVERLCEELVLWGAQGDLARRPVSTVHLGGGTPTYLGPEGLTRIVEACRQHLGIGPDTEWALESTSQELTPRIVETMHDLGFRRLHLGVQTLQDEARLAIGRKTSAREVLARIESTLGLGWVVSVDLICGLPFQTLAGVVADLDALLAAGVNGFSLYELLIYPQNRRWAASHGVDSPERHERNHWMFIACADLLERRGFRKNVFNHWSDKRDNNVYFTFPSREEDLLAIGAIADGVFGDYHYRHPPYVRYLDSCRAGQPGLEGGLRRPPEVARTQRLVTAILGARIPAEQVRALADLPGGEPLLERWRRSHLVRLTADGDLELTATGSWFAGNMVREVGPVNSVAGAPSISWGSS
jgi:coproporphyrinogen III oxidase-like Fe-S oxidoreductase